MSSMSILISRSPGGFRGLASRIRSKGPYLVLSLNKKRHSSQTLSCAASGKNESLGPYAGLKVNQARLMSDIHYTCQWGTGERWGSAETETGMSRLSLSDADREARDWFVETTNSLGCKVSVDSMGNIFAVRPGKKTGPPTCAGSHLDTQPAGGRYDGILGVCAGVEMLRVLHEEKIETEFPVGVVNWTNEEGARFPISMMSSAVWAGKIPLEKAHNLKEVGAGGRTVKQELERIGYLGDMEASYKAMPLGAHFELHIEQGPLLESSSQRIGIVHGVQAYRWHTITIHGASSHTGTTSFPYRSDALLTASRCIIHSHNLATTHSCLASTGILALSPSSTNTVPSQVTFSLDIRAPSDNTLLAFESALKDSFALIASDQGPTYLHSGSTPGRPCSIEWRLDAPSPAVSFDEECVRCVERSAETVLCGKGETRRMVSGAGHDSVETSARCPTAMVFVPCRGGVSHNPKEFCEEKDCATGAQVLIGAMLGFDQRRGMV